MPTGALSVSCLGSQIGRLHTHILTQTHRHTHMHKASRVGLRSTHRAIYLQRPPPGARTGLGATVAPGQRQQAFRGSLSAKLHDTRLTTRGPLFLKGHRPLHGVAGGAACCWTATRPSAATRSRYAPRQFCCLASWVAAKDDLPCPGRMRWRLTRPVLILTESAAAAAGKIDDERKRQNWTEGNPK